MKPSLLFFLITIFLFACNQQQTRISSESKTDSSLNQNFTAVTACMFSEIAYCTDASKKTEETMPGWKVVWDPAAVKGIYAFLATDGKKYILAIRGSLIEFSWDAFDNWLYKDFNVTTQEKWIFSNDTKEKISEGAYQGWQNIEKMVDKNSGKTLWQFLKENTNASTPILLTGHSLGGNLATVYASYLFWKYKQEGIAKQNMTVITLAAPAAGNREFAHEFDKNFPDALRIENVNDIVPKFPCSNKLADLGKLYTPGPSAHEITVGYKNATVTLNSVFTSISLAQKILEFRNDSYCQPCGEGKLITIQLSGENKTNDVAAWFAEAGYQHGIAQYAKGLNAPVIVCGN